MKKLLQELSDLLKEDKNFILVAVIALLAINLIAIVFINSLLL